MRWPGITDEDHVLRGRSLFKIANGEDTDRIAFSEFHAAGSRTAFYMVDRGQINWFILLIIQTSCLT